MKVKVQVTVLCDRSTLSTDSLSASSKQRGKEVCTRDIPFLLVITILPPTPHIIFYLPVLSCKVVNHPTSYPVEEHESVRI